MSFLGSAFVSYHFSRQRLKKSFCRLYLFAHVSPFYNSSTLISSGNYPDVVAHM
jgi:hypothetical protein